MATVLIVDDEKDIVSALKIYLRPEGYDLLEAYTGLEALEIVKNQPVDLVLMDIMMPGMDGMQATSLLREISNIPVILLTAKSEDTDKIMGLNIGADDYITKPFNPAEVVARVRSQLRRYMRLGGQPVTPGKLVIGGIVLDDAAKSVTVDDVPISLTPMEFGILKLLMEQPGQVFSSEEIYRRVWKDTPLGSEGTVAVHIRHLREKIEINPSEPRYIKVVWGQGYKVEAVNEK
ncbi:MAG: response regulator transcription factor [Solobacterium sp.]|nr:response regulator transcription factor [Solobacterium sp.]MBR3128555.1 response regulator transcription factor [Solobacterium sp.]